MSQQYEKTNVAQISHAVEVKALPLPELPLLCESLRQDIIAHTSLLGGHIGASLGCVEFIVALHRVFTTPEDAFVFDVGHQAYAHKMLTDRRFHFYTLRKENGLSGFSNRFESEHDAFGAGHASTAISAALGLATGKLRQKKSGRVVAVVGDGALTGGLAFEGLNQAGALKTPLIILFNDNEMSIDTNVGALKDSFKLGTNAKSFFEILGCKYLGPFDGHDLDVLIPLFENLKIESKPVVVHLKTVKGKGYVPAEKDKTRFHGCGPFDRDSGTAVPSLSGRVKFQDLFASTLSEMAAKDTSIVAITAAMPSGTSLAKFAKTHPDKFYDVGIAEAHAVLFSAGLAIEGCKPFVCIYSTFLQRAFDQLIHDVALQKLPVRFCLDRGGVVGDDGATHQGVFDLAYMAQIPNMVVMAPRDEAMLQHMLETAREYSDGPISLRFPRGEVFGVPLPEKPLPLLIGTSEKLVGDEVGDVLILAVGITAYRALQAAKILQDAHHLKVTVVDLRFVKPLDSELILRLAPHFKLVLTVEEGVKCGGVGAQVAQVLLEHGEHVLFKSLGVPDRFIEHATQDRQRVLCQIDADSIIMSCLELLLPKSDEATVIPIKRKAI